MMKGSNGTKKDGYDSFSRAEVLALASLSFRGNTVWERNYALCEVQDWLSEQFGIEPEEFLKAVRAEKIGKRIKFPS